MPSHIAELAERAPVLAPLRESLEDAADCIVNAVRSGGRLFTCGNGGSAADAEHIVGELMKGFLLKRPLAQERKSLLLRKGCDAAMVEMLQDGVPALSLVGGVSLPTAFINDVHADYVFAQQLLVLGKAPDVLLAISTSGNSKNILAAASLAKGLDMTVIGLTGSGGGRLAPLCDILLAAPSAHTPRIQEFHLQLYHTLCAEIEARLFGSEEA